jgi:hypothetical protein
MLAPGPFALVFYFSFSALFPILLLSLLFSLPAGLYDETIPIATALWGKMGGRKKMSGLEYMGTKKAELELDGEHLIES